MINTIAEQLNWLNVKANSKKEAIKKEVASSTTKPYSLYKAKSWNLDILRTISEQIKELDRSSKNKALTYLDKTC